MPQLHDNLRQQGCWECGSLNHRQKQCPKRHRPNKQCKYCQSQSHQTPQCLFKRLDIPPPPTHTITETPIPTPIMLTWCGKCLCNNLGHKEVDCPTRELCCNCGRQGNLFFLCTHKCNDDHDQCMYGEDN